MGTTKVAISLREMFAEARRMWVAQSRLSMDDSCYLVTKFPLGNASLEDEPELLKLRSLWEERVKQVTCSSTGPFLLLRVEGPAIPPARARGDQQSPTALD